MLVPTVPQAWVLDEAGLRCWGDPLTEGAIVEYEIAARLSPASPLPGYGLGDCLRGRASNDEAMTVYQQAIALDNDNSLRRHLTLGWICTYQQEWDRAIAAYQRAVQLAPDNASYHASLAGVLSQQGDVSQAIVEYEQAARLDPRNASYRVRLADLYRDAGRAEKAKAAYETALTLRPDDEYVRQQLAQLP